MRVRAAVAAGLALVAAVVVVSLSQSRARLAGTNSLVATSRIDRTVAPHAERCQPNETVPAGSAAVRLFVTVRADEPAGPLAVTFTSPQGRLAGRSRAALRSGPVRIPIA